MAGFFDQKFRRRIFHFAVLWWLSLLINPFGTIFGSPVTPAQYLQEDWQYFQKHNHNLSLAYANDYIAFYIDEDVNSSETQWIYSPLSEAWKLVLTLHDPSIFGNDSLLYVSHHEQKYNGRHSAIFTEDTHGFRNIIDCGHNEPVEENKPLVDTCKLGSIIQLVTGIVKEVIWTSKNVTTTNLISDWGFLKIFIYDLYIQKGTNENETAADFIEEIINQGSAYPREGSYLLRDWYLPIYRDHGGSATVQRFLNLQNGYLNNKSMSEPILPGEFVYLWSEASGSDLRELAYDTFGWTLDYRSQFEKAAKRSSSRNYSAQITRRLRPRWTEHWDDHNDELNLFYSDDHLAVYFDNYVNASRPWSFQHLSNAWNYAKETFGPLSSDPILYFVLHKKVDYCRASKETSYYDQSYEHKNVIDCGTLTSSGGCGWDADLASNFDLLLENIGHLVLRNYNETGNWPGVRSSGWSMSSILVYDIFKSLNRSDDADRWMELQIISPQDVPKENTYWFRDWYLPIYNEYGGAEALARFLAILNQNWPKKKNDYTFKLSIGTLVHFWSGAAGENLWPLAAETFSLNTWEHKQFLRAVKDYPNVLYKSTYRNATVFIPPAKLQETWGRPDIHEEELSLIFVDYNVAVYFDDAMDITVTWPFKLLSDSWGYATKTYGPFSPDPILYVALHDNKYGKCETSREITYFDKDYANRSVIDCGSLNSGWQTTRLMNLLMEQIAFLVMRSAKERGNWPGYQVSEFSMTEILIFDIYMGIGRTEEAVKWHKDQLESGYESPRENTFWYLNWYYPIYAKFGYGKVINDLFTILDQHWPKADNGFDYAVDLNVGEFLHFWSGAAGVNLKSVANETFGWSELSEKRFNKAKENYPAIQYKDLTEPLTVKTQPLYFTENTFEHQEYVFQNYVDQQLLGYIDADVPRSVQWPFELLSTCWIKGQRIYKTMETILADSAESSKTVIQFVLHSGRHFGCRKSVFDKEFAIDCGTESTTWDPTPKNTDAIVNSFVNMVQMTANLLLDEETLSLQAFSQFLTFDTYLNLQRFEDAHRILTREINKFERTAGAGGFGIRDWYLPIYVNYGGTSVFSAFLKLLSSNWVLNDQRKDAAVEKLNTGQTIHFWSEASDQNLFAASETIFSWNANQRKEFEEARNEFSRFNYTCYDCHLTNSGTEAQNNLLVIAVAISLACMVLFAIFIPLLVYRRKLNSLKAQIRELTSDEIKEFFEGNGNVTAEDGYSSIESKPFNKDYEIPKERLEVALDSVLGSGEFGLVVRGILKGDAASATIDTPVAIKTVKPNVDVTCFKALLTELKVIGYLGPHDHIASLLGALTVNIRNREVYVALEFCAKGDLLGYVKKNRPHFKDLFKEETIAEASKAQGSRSTLLTDILNNMENHIENPTIVQEEVPSMDQKEKEADPTVEFSTSDLLEWSSQVASGMAFIASKKVIHGDLAARNILLTANNVAKISDFGLSRQLANYSNYMKTSKTPVPWRWMAIESLRDMNFSVQSDAWAYGVTLYEIFSLGTTPYAGWTWDYEFIDKLAAGHRLSSPEFGDENIYALMMDCMKKEPEERLTFQEMICKLNEIKCKLFPQLAGDVNPNYIQIGK